jgi:hypothetical protein
VLKRAPFIVSLLCVCLIGTIAAQEPPSDNKHGIMVREAQIYVSPDTSSAKIGEITRGREVVVLDQSREWVHVLASLTQEKDVTGWMFDKGIVHIDTPNGDQILFGEAAASELQASMRGGRKGAADDARRLYYRVFDYFPKSPLAGEGLYRAADIIWQIDAADARSRPSSKMRNPDDRAEIPDEYMKMVEKKFPRTKWADLAAFHLLDNKLCGDWMGQSKCPDREAELYEKYAAERPDSPNAPEALYNAATRRAALIEIYKTENKPKQSEESRAKVKADAGLALSKYPTTDWAFRLRALAFMVDQNIPTYGNSRE